MKLKTILLAEDNQNDVDLALLTLSQYNLANNIEVVSDGVEVLEYLKSQGRFKGRKTHNPAVILINLKMSRMDGIEVLKVIKNDPFLRLIPVIMVTSSLEEQDLLQSYKLGVNAYLIKPIDFKKFIEAIKQLGAFWAILDELP